MDAISSPEPRYRLALFPLPVVLMPSARMPLHVFEPRYRNLVADCLEGDGRFGMVYHDWDRQGPFLSEEGRVGCVAEIEEHELLEDGRSLLVVRGVERFRISDGIESESLYFEALVTPFDDAPPPDADKLENRRQESIRLLRTVVSMLTQSPDALPDLDASGEVSFRVAQTIQVDPAWQQGLLEIRDESARLELLNRILTAALDS